MSHTYVLKVSYLGTRYSGWQKQPNLVTVQGSIEDALSTLAINEAVSTLGSGRTDTGVHAFGQIVRVTLDREIESYKLMSALNSRLNSDIRILSAAVAPSEFHPVRDALNKEYWYLLSTDTASPFLSPMVVQADANLDWRLMQEAAKLFEGEWDFKCYQTVGTPVNTTVRTIYNCQLENIALGEIFGSAVSSGQVWRLQINGSGFLKQMVRLIVGTLLSVGKGHVSLSQVRDSLLGNDNQKLASVAPAHGLFLHHVTYSHKLF